MADESIISYSNIIGEDDTFVVLNKELDDLEARVLEIAKNLQGELNVVNPNDETAIKKITKELVKLEQAEKNLNKQRAVTAKAKKKINNLTDEELIQREKEKIQNRERVQRAKQLAIIRNNEANSIASLRARLSLVTLEWKKLSKEERENSKAGRALVKQKLALTNQLKALEKQTGDTRRNVGNYSDSLSKLGKLTARVFIGRSVFDGLRRIGSAASDLIEQNKDTDESIGDLSKALGRFAKSAGSAGLTILKFVAGPITSLINGVRNTLEFLGLAKVETEEFSATSEQLAEVTNQLNQEFEKELVTANQLFNATSKANEGSKERKELIDTINAQYGQYLPNLLTEKSSLEDIAAAQDLVNAALTQGFLIRVQQATQTDIFTNKVKDQIAVFKSLQERAERAGQSIDSGLLGTFSRLTEEFGKSSEEFKFVRDVIQGVENSFGALGQEIAKTNPDLVELARQLKLAGDSDLILDLLDSATIRTAKYNEEIKGTQSALASLEDGLVTYDRTVTNNTNNLNANTTALNDNTEARLKAINALARQLAEVEAGNIEDAQARALRLEDLRFEAENKARIANFKKLKDLLEGQDEELRQAERLNQKLSEEQLERSEQNKLNIRKQFAIKTVDIAALTQEQIDANNKEARNKAGKEFKSLFDEEIKLVDDGAKATEEANEKKKKSNEQLFKSIQETGQKIGELITDAFEKQADLAEERLDKQQTALENARERARAGLTNNLKFEQEELARREKEKIESEKRAQQAAKLTALFNIVSAAAASGDSNAAITGIVQFGILEAFSAAIEGSFFDGTEDLGKTMNPLDSKGGRLIMAHDNERILSKAQNSELLRAGMSNDDLVQYALMGQQLSDGTQMLDINHYKKQTDDFVRATHKTDAGQDFGRLESEMRELRKAFSKMPNYSEEIEKVSDNYYILLKKYTKGNVTKTETVKKRI